MSQFDVNVVTVDAQAVFSRILATNQLIYTRVLTSTSAMSAAEAQLAQVSDFSGPEGTIKAASAQDDVARIVGVVTNAPASVTVKTFALCGKAEGDASDVVLAVLSSANLAVVIPSTSQPTAGVEIGFLLRIVDAETSTVQVIGTGSAALSDLDRFVSMYKAGDPTSGENQTILGNKSFSGSTSMQAAYATSLGITGDAVVGGSVSMLSTDTQSAVSLAYLDDGDGGAVAVTGDIVIRKPGMLAGSYLHIDNVTTATGMRASLLFPDYTGHAPSIYMYANAGDGEYSELSLSADAVAIFGVNKGISLRGFAPSYDSSGSGTLTPQIGGLVLAAIRDSAFSAATYSAGDTLSLAAGDASVAAYDSNGWGFGAADIGAGTYTLLTSGTVLSGAANIALIQRIS